MRSVRRSGCRSTTHIQMARRSPLLWNASSRVIQRTGSVRCWSILAARCFGGDVSAALRQAAVAAGGSAAEVFARFDVVGFDPRGVGASRPLIDCGSATDRYQAADFAPRTTRQQRVLVAETRRFVRACAQSSGKLLRFVDTTSVVRDIDQIRDALGEPTISYLGYSYGTVLGAAYAHLFPNRVRALVLDGAVNPNTILDTVAGQSEQDRV